VFSGIIEARASILFVKSGNGLTRICVEQPPEFDDLKLGDSIAVNGICLTLETQELGMHFSLGPETLKVTHWQPVQNETVNLERSLRFGDRVHGHIVSGHVDTTGIVKNIELGEETRTLTIAAPADFAPYLWRKGSVAVQGVSLTLNFVENTIFHVGLIPETLKRTNLGLLKVGDPVHLEADAMARAWFHWRNLK
jgi:riboflavin synthase